MSSYDPPEDLISEREFKESMKLVRLQIGLPISVLMAVASNLVCALAIKPGLGQSISTRIQRRRHEMYNN